MATKDCISKLMKTIHDQNTAISQLEDKFAVLKDHIMHLEKQNNENEQYQHRLCLQIHGIDFCSKSSGIWSSESSFLMTKAHVHLVIRKLISRS